jgi:hypothetical protein
MSFDGEYQTEHPEFDDLESLWDYANDIGSKWFFYPFYFAVKGKTIADKPEFPLDFLKGKRVSTVSKLFKRLSKKPDAQDLDSDEFAFYVADNTK